MDPVSAIASVLALCGIASLRNFAPLFLFGLAARTLPGFAWCPDATRRVLESAPGWLVGDVGLCVFGVLAAIEVAANWNDTAREMLEESGWDRWVKPVLAFCAAFALLSPEHREVAEHVVGGALPQGGAPSFLDYVRPAVAAASGSVVTWALCRIRLGIAEGLRSADPENDFGLHWIAAGVEETLWTLALVALVLVPLLAALLVAAAGIAGWLLRGVLVRMAERRRRRWDSLSPAQAVRVLDVRVAAIFALGAVLTAIPFVGFAAVVVALKVSVFAVFRLYESGGRRLVFGIVLRALRLSALLVAFVFSGVPFLGLLLLSPYIAVYIARRRRFLARAAG
ncbi:MAG: hypothetical protein IJI73_04915 [Kiritimatiellae bacterium]|nr:hypothetical protein [Kiritimatiellia bacterium]